MDVTSIAPQTSGTNWERYEGLTLRLMAAPAWAVIHHRQALATAGIRAVVVDTETISLEVSEGSVTEIAWYDIIDGVGGSFVPPHSLTHADAYALKVSRYWERIADQPTDLSQIEHLHRILGGDGQPVMIVGSNPQFDKNHLNALFLAHNLTPDPWQRRSADVGAAGYWLTGRPTGQLTGLADTAAALGIDTTGQHDAWVDVVITAQVWHALETLRDSRAA